MGKLAGRPTIYSEELVERILHLVATTPKGLPKLCAENDWMPNPDTIHAWRYKDKAFSDRYLEAKRMQLIVQSEESQDLARSALDHTYIDKEGNVKVDAGAVAALRLILDNDKWFYERLAQNVFGARTETTHIVKTHEEWLKELEE
jgi:hypothetical protein